MIKFFRRIRQKLLEQGNLKVATDSEFENFIFNQIWFTQRKINGAKELLTLNNEILDEIQKAK
ncbi:hypothetical protein SAMN00777080_1306 [Aquiflexum balticum DSM 16537]|uniref:Uncharacterized protein n=1 Tax=Aquiflexum balticum DSM 16537 TaxID=758820 RepID=A0A1W2H292_9BACT|nr:hypothetical protein [Aquiflexum balticum]SMD42742.1 hypothetical protein SAMN00777080_1306 [Aquiflexum balticum DSM 16537]